MDTPEPVAAFGHVSHEPLELEHAGQPVLRPQVGGQPTAVGPDEQELHLVADERVDSGVGQPAFDAAQRPAAAVGVRSAVLVEESAWRPSQSVTEDAQRAEVDADPLVPDHADGVAERRCRSGRW